MPRTNSTNATRCARQQRDEMNKRDGNGHTTQWRAPAVARFGDEPLPISDDVAATPKLVGRRRHRRNGASAPCL